MALLDRVSRLVVVDDHFVLCRSIPTRSLAMETQNQTHPTPRQLAAYALNKLTPESREPHEGASVWLSDLFDVYFCKRHK